MTAITEKFVLIGPRKGEDLVVNGHQFIGGEYEFTGSPDQIISLTKVFSFYGAMPADQAELAELRAAAATTNQNASVVGNAAGNDSKAQPTGNASGPEASQPPTPAVGSTENPAPIETPADNKLTLAEAVAALDPDVDSHWTSNNLPGLDDLEHLTGKKVSRADVDAIAAGYTRAKARQAKAML